MSELEKNAYPSFLGKGSVYQPGSKFLPHEIRYEYAIAALEECRLKGNQSLTKEQETRIQNLIRKDRKKFIGFEVVGWLAFALNFATFVPLLVEVVNQETTSQKINLIIIGLVDQLLWLIYAIGIRSLPILLLSILLIPMFIAMLILLS